MLIAQCDENTCRKDFTPSEAVAVGAAVEAIESKAAKERQREHGKTAPGRRKNTCGKLPPQKKAKTREKVAAAVGMKARTYEKAKAVVQAAREDPEHFGPLGRQRGRGVTRRGPRGSWGSVAVGNTSRGRPGRQRGRGCPESRGVRGRPGCRQVAVSGRCHHLQMGGTPASANGLTRAGRPFQPGCPGGPGNPQIKNVTQWRSVLAAGRQPGESKG